MRRIAAWAGLFAITGSVPAFAAGAIGFEDPSQLAAAARTAASKDLGPLTDGQRLEVGPIEPGLQLRQCDRPVGATRAPGLRTPHRVLLELRCSGSAPWHIYVPVRVVGVTPVAVAAHAIVAGTVLTPADVQVERLDLTGLPPGYLNAATIAVGLTAARPIAGGAILTNQMLLGQTAVRRGQTVTLVAESGEVSVRMNGRALTDGLVNQRIKVENLSSGKIVEGIARSDQTVEIFVP